MGYLRRISDYPERKTLFDSTHVMNMIDPMAIYVETLMMDSGCSLEKQYTELIHMNPKMILCKTIN